LRSGLEGRTAMKRFKLIYALLAFTSGVAASAAVAQPASETSRTVTLFSNKVEMPPGGSVAAMEVEVKDWLVPKAPSGLQIPAQGFYVAQLLSGVVTTDIKGKSETRKPGDFWTVDAGSSMSVTLAPRKESAQLRMITLSSVP
jgi:hypothetical protein